jgi:hypothetical protein
VLPLTDPVTLALPDTVTDPLTELVTLSEADTDSELDALLDTVPLLLSLMDPVPDGELLPDDDTELV